MLAAPIGASSFDDKFLENAAAMLVIFKLIEAGARGREQHHVARFRASHAISTARLDRSRVLHRDGITQLRRDFFGSRADEKPTARAREAAHEARCNALPLSLPPRITISEPGNASMAFSVASTFVAFESL